MYRDFDALGIEPPDPRAPRHRVRAADAAAIDAPLEGQGWPTARGDGDVNYAVRKFPATASCRQVVGRAARRRAGRGADGKDDPLDFVLWKAAKRRRTRRCQMGQPFGRPPGWHIECSAMACACWAKPSTSTAADA